MYCMQFRTGYVVSATQCEINSASGPKIKTNLGLVVFLGANFPMKLNIDKCVSTHRITAYVTEMVITFLKVPVSKDCTRT
jgi:hypothetical protein